MVRKFTAVYEKDDDWWIGYVEELPGANSQGETLDEVKENLLEAVQLIIEANRELSTTNNTNSEVIKEELILDI